MNPDIDEVRLVDVPMHDELTIGTVRSIAEQCCADDLQEWYGGRRERVTRVTGSVEIPLVRYELW